MPLELSRWKSEGEPRCRFDAPLPHACKAGEASVRRVEHWNLTGLSNRACLTSPYSASFGAVGGYRPISGARKCATSDVISSERSGELEGLMTHGTACALEDAGVEPTDSDPLTVREVYGVKCHGGHLEDPTAAPQPMAAQAVSSSWR
jgi:hypothetical protein